MFLSPVLFIAAAAWVVAQGAKLLIYAAVDHKFDLIHLRDSGGMPSAHSAFVCACTTAIAFASGLDSELFALAVVMSIIVMYDAANVRRETGEQAKVLNYMMKHWHQHQPELFGEELKELIGHTPLQVAVGAIFGVITGLVGGLIVY